MAQYCYCGSDVLFSSCCEIYIKGIEKAPTAEKLMRSRFSAYATQSVDYLINTTHISTRKIHKRSEILIWAKSNQWIKLEIISYATSVVEFKAHYLDSNFKLKIHHEKSFFLQENGAWFYVDADFY